MLEARIEAYQEEVAMIRSAQVAPKEVNYAMPLPTPQCCPT